MSDDSIFADGTPRTAVPHTLGSGYPPLRWQASPGRGSDGGEVIPSRRDLSLSLSPHLRAVNHRKIITKSRKLHYSGASVQDNCYFGVAFSRNNGDCEN